MYPTVIEAEGQWGYGDARSLIQHNGLIEYSSPAGQRNMSGAVGGTNHTIGGRMNHRYVERGMKEKVLGPALEDCRYE